MLDHQQKYQVHVLDGITRVAELTAFERVEAIEVDLDHGNWAVTLNADHLSGGLIAEAIIEATYLGIEIVNVDTGWRFSGPCNYLDRTYRRLNEITRIEMRGVDWMDWLGALLEWPDTTDVTNWWASTALTAPLSIVVLSALAGNGGAFALPERQIPHLRVIGPPSPIGASRRAPASRQPLGEVWRPMFEGTDHTFRLALHREPSVDELRFEVASRAVSPMIVTPGMQGEIRVTEVAAQATFIAAMGDRTGALDPDERHAIGVQGAETGWRTRRRERHVNAPSADLASLAGVAAAELAAAGPKQTVTVPDFDLPEYGDTTRLGDYVRVHYADTADDFLVGIGSSTLTGTPEGWQRSVSIGRDIPVGPRQLAAAHGDLARRFRRLEGNV